jgi:hypothetical protein
MRHEFKDLKSCEEGFSLFTIPFCSGIKKAALNGQMELDELQKDSVLKENYNEFRIPAFHTHPLNHFSACLTLHSKPYLCLVAYNFANHCSWSWKSIN